MRQILCLCCGRQFRLSTGGGSDLARHVIGFHSESGHDINKVVAWMVEDGAFLVVRESRAA